MRARLLCIVFAAGLIPLYIGMRILQAMHWNQSYETRLEQIREHGTALAGLVAQNGYLHQQSQAEVTARIYTLADLWDGYIMLVNNGLVVVKDTTGRQDGKTLISQEAIFALDGKTSIYYNGEKGVVEVVLPIVLGASAESEGQVIGAVVVEASFGDIVEEHKQFQDNTIILTACAGLILLVVATVVSGGMTRSLRTLARRIDDVTESYDGPRRIEAGKYTEVRQIAEAVDRMMERAAATEKSRQEFVSNVSHELKTPLTAIKVLSDSLILEPEVPIEMYREFITDINAEIDREAKIVNDLLALVKLDKTSGELNIAEVNINELLEIIMKRLKPLALKRGIEMVFESYRTVLAEVDEVKISLVFTNLIENAIKYNRDGGKVMVSLNSDHRYFYVKVEDTGVGIPEEEQGLVFDRFYRVDKARSRETGGTGLGLSITKGAVQLHRGSIKVQSIPGVGSIFTVRIPLSFVMTVQ